MVEQVYTVMQTKSPKGRDGTAAASEPETRALLRALNSFNPRLIISIHSISDRRECNKHCGIVSRSACKRVGLSSRF